MVPWAHTSPHPTRHHDRFNRFCTAHDRESLGLYFTMVRLFSLKLHLRTRVWTPIEYMVPWAHLSPQHISIGSDVLCGANDYDNLRDRPLYSVCNTVTVRPHRIYLVLSYRDAAYRLAKASGVQVYSLYKTWNAGSSSARCSTGQERGSSSLEKVQQPKGFPAFPIARMASKQFYLWSPYM